MTASHEKQNFGIIQIFHSLGVGVYWDEAHFLKDSEYGATYLIPHGQEVEYQVVLRNGLPLDELRKTAAHELGHIVMGHLLRGYLLNEPGTKQHEHEAEEFASFITPFIWR